MSETTLLVGPFNRVEGDLEVKLTLRDGAVAAAHVNAPLFRGFEVMLLGKDPRDALTLVPRICGICSISQSAAAAQALAAAQGLEPSPDGAAMAALIHAVENACDHLSHFHLFFMPDFARGVYAGRAWHGRAVERFAAMSGRAARAAVAARAEVMHILGLMAGKWPHTLAIQPGGVTRTPTMRDRVRILASLRAFRGWMEAEMFGGRLEDFAALRSVEDLMRWTGGDVGLFLEIAADCGLEGLGRGAGRYMSFGAYPLETGPVFARGLWDGGLRALDTGSIVEDVSHAWMLGEARHPWSGETRPDARMAEPGYTWCKAPRLEGKTWETGAIARQVVAGHPLALDLARQGGVLARVAGRLLELALLAGAMERLAGGIRPEARFLVDCPMPSEARGEGLVEAARGSLGHWLRVEKGRIAGYQIVAPTTWNFSPRDAGGVPGPLEAALEGVPVGEGEAVPVTVQHVVRSFDPCMVCTVH